MKFVCQDCTSHWQQQVLRPIQDIFERVMPGEPMPAGECPSCGALCHAEVDNSENYLLDALLVSYGALCARMDPNKRPRTPIDWKMLDAAIARASGGKAYSTLMAERWTATRGKNDE